MNSKNPGEGLKIVWEFLMKLLHFHTYPERKAGEVRCDCGHEPVCPIHRTKLKMHGYDNNIDCMECLDHNMII